jgi:hypothetical protein
MKYQQPYGVTDPNAPYINGNPAAGIEGSIPPALAFEEPMREIVNFITDSGMTPNDNDLHQLAESVQSGQVNYGIDAGTQNAMITRLTPGLPAYYPGLIARVKALHGNLNDATHTTFTLDAGCGPAPVVRSDGSLPVTGDVPAGAITTYVFDGTRWQIQNFLGAGGGTGGGGTNNTYIVKIPYVVDTGPGPNVVVANFSPAIAALNAGDPIMVKISHTNSGPSNIIVNALSAKAIVRNDGNLSPLQQSDMPAGAILFLVYDGTQFLIVAGAGNFGVPNKLVKFMSSQNWTVPNGIYRVRAKCWGGGGAGGGCGPADAGGGGGGGGFTDRICQVTPGQVIAVTVGAGGPAQPWGLPKTNNGGTSSFGGYCSATGGGGAGDTSYVYGSVGGSFGSGSGGDDNRDGGYGSPPQGGRYPILGGQAGGYGGDCAGGGGQGNPNGLGGPSAQAGVPGGGGEGCPSSWPGPGTPGGQGMVTVEY